MRWLVLAGGSQAAAERFASSLGEDSMVVVRADVRASLGRARWRSDTREYDALAIHTPDWQRQRAPQIYELAAAIAPVRKRLLADDSSGVVRTLSSTELALRVAGVPFAAAAAVVRSAAEATRFSLTRARAGGRSTRRASGSEPRRPAILAIWVGDSVGDVGGSVTHISGILQGFKSAGFRVGLVSLAPVPQQIARVLDDLELGSPLSRGARLTSDVEGLVLNQTIRPAARRLAARLRPAIVYQRHRALLTAGIDVAAASGADFVLEWNASEVWTRANWGEPSGLSRHFDRLVRAMERSLVERADLTVSVSTPAAEAAIEAGAPLGRVLVVPNGVDIEEVDRALASSSRAHGIADALSVGWIGSFDLFHGVEVLVRAVALLPQHVSCVLIGDGARRVSSEQLARTLGVADRIEWTGVLPHAEALVRLAGCDVLASPHPPLADRTFFGSPTKLFEYMALSRPIVASALGQIAEVLEDGRTARLVVPGDPHALAEGIREVLALPDRGKALGRAARLEAESRHTWDGRANEILKRLESI